MKLLWILLLLTGCSTIVPIKTPLPDAPSILMTPAIELEVFGPELLTLSGIIDKTKTNYAICYSNAVQLNSLQQWYKDQQKLFNK